jgi:DNA-binding NtrC family response regulator
MDQSKKGWLDHTMAKSEKSSQLKILYGEGDAEVLASQVVSIQKAGHQVETAVGRKGIDEAARRGAFDLVILGPTLTKNDRHHLPYVIKKAQRATRILVMHTDGEGHPAVDANTDTGRSMADVVAKIAVLMAENETAQHGQAKCAAAGK